ncbi:nucleoside diphosphate kinase 7 isoform X1 [Cimex lectularius]|uniref:DM10 domain-containing protein n=1 Tax=Cimex lectularius TaxID=79782 RepID=A0A8I6S4S9_CIMLE|nr:nucleoside diphosphate kinase 7 isoform X1 [Cimex lectularius]
MSFDRLPVITNMDRYAFLAEWFEPESFRIRKFILFYYPIDHSIALYDIDYKRQFLRRTNVENITPEDMFVGNTMKIFARHFKITDYGNDYTRKVMGINMQRTLGIIKPEALNQKGAIIRMLTKHGFKVSKLRMLHMTEDLVKKLYSHHKDSLSFPAVIAHMTSSPVIAMELLNDYGVSKLNELTGPSNPEIARTENPESIRACFGFDEMRNGFYCSPSQEDAEHELETFFGNDAPLSSTTTDTCVLVNTTCCVVKPHAVREGYLGDIINFIEKEGYMITAMQMFYLDHVHAEEFLEVYRGVLKEYPDIINEMTSGGCVAMEIMGPTKEETPQDFRNFVGPSDPEMARHLRPDTLRAQFGKTKVQNAVHVTDLPEDALLEVEYFFKILV